jgi:hypothetical protein
VDSLLSPKIEELSSAEIGGSPRPKEAEMDIEGFLTLLARFSAVASTYLLLLLAIWYIVPYELAAWIRRRRHSQ